MNQPLKIAICAGEVSGDLLGGHLINALKQQYPDCEIFGIGGKQMIAAGCESFFNQERLAVRGLVEVLKRLPEILSIRKNLINILLDKKPDIFIGIDSPDFNFSIEKKLKKAGIQTVPYVSPSVWAWRGGRVKKIVKIADMVLCLFPMEPELYQKAGGNAVFVGHPLAQTIDLTPNTQNAKQFFRLPENNPIFTLLPGSRMSELEYLAEIFIQTAGEIVNKIPNAQFLLPAATEKGFQYLQNLLNQEKYRHLPIHLINGQAQIAIIAADCVLAASGTVTLEVALCKKPMVIAYKISPITFAIVKRIFQLPYIGLPNILLKKFAVPELLQQDANPIKLADELCKQYQQNQQSLIDDFSLLYKELKQNTNQIAANAVLSLINKE
ncbi:MAG: lipid-A-disaccharide synthase [Neisseriaceae bacterium]|nr:lipid-A-disaccharide synthase [Neisseriaceae bacterium]